MSGTDHYGGADVAERVLASLDPARMDRLAALDQFHVGGAAASRRLAARAELREGLAVLDLGSGLGGPARILAGEFGADVTGIDLTPGFCRIAQALSVRSQIAATTRFCAAEALALPFADASFDAIWTEHVAMNIEARDALYRELLRVTRPGGVLALYDIVAGADVAALVYPVPWASDASRSHLIDAAALRSVATEAGWTERHFYDESAAAREWLANARPPKGTGGPSLRDVMGPAFPSMIANLRENFEAGRLRAVQAVFEKQAASI
ncbi:MAG: class I SAM-dependent methyltransferase [Alphaproteobacteria bacterium]